MVKLKRYGVYSENKEYEVQGMEGVRQAKHHLKQIGEKHIGHYEKEDDRYWIHREQIGKVRGVQRLGFKPVNKRQSFWSGK